jgi:hypothetical protein
VREKLHFVTEKGPFSGQKYLCLGTFVTEKWHFVTEKGHFVTEKGPCDRQKFRNTGKYRENFAGIGIGDPNTGIPESVYTGLETLPML